MLDSFKLSKYEMLMFTILKSECEYALFLTRQLVSKQGYFLYTDKLNLVTFGLRHSDLQIRYFDVAGQVN